MDTQPGLGRQLRALRKQLGLSIAEVALDTDISPSFLSLVEKGKSDIAIGRLQRLTSFYGVGLADVLPHADASMPEVIQPGEHRLLPSAGEKLEVVLLTNDGNRIMQPIISRYEVGGETSEHVRQEGDLFIYVLRGEITIDVENQEPIVLREGGTAYLASGTPRRYRNDGTERVELLAVLARPLDDTGPSNGPQGFARARLAV